MSSRLCCWYNKLLEWEAGVRRRVKGVLGEAWDTVAEGALARASEWR